jgi:hypothetical protein
MVDHQVKRGGAGLSSLRRRPPFPIPALRAIRHLAKVPLLFFLLCKLLLRLLDEPLRQTRHPRVPSQTGEVMNVVLFAPTQQAPAAETRIAPENNFHRRPGLPQSFDRQLEHRPGVMCRIAAGRSQIRHQQLLAAKHIQRQETTIPVATVKEPPFLLAMHAIIGRITIQDQLGGRVRKGGNER